MVLLTIPVQRKVDGYFAQSTAKSRTVILISNSILKNLVNFHIQILLRLKMWNEQ